ncbi:MAG: GIY-YIG nuclease family protein [Alphaproteobacteria bacterium]|nr:GIY-YIG nuclease family protein [Alphaproteobacteria bacterium]
MIANTPANDITGINEKDNTPIGYGALSSAITEIIKYTHDNKIETTGFHIFNEHELRGDTELQAENWNKFQKEAGVYCVFNWAGDKTKYVGMSTSNLGERVFFRLFEKKGKISTLTDKNDIILTIAISLKDKHIAPSLEAYLIEKLDPKQNRKK